MPTDRADPLAHQNMRDRFYGQEDPVAAKMMARQDEMPKLEPPEDEGISSLWLGNMSDNITPEVRSGTTFVVRLFLPCCGLCWWYFSISVFQYYSIRLLYEYCMNITVL